MFPNSLPVLNSRCAHKHSCSVFATTNMFGDPCPGTHKYLEAHYQCISALQTTTTTNRPNLPMGIPFPPFLPNNTIIGGSHVPSLPRIPPPFVGIPISSMRPPTNPYMTGNNGARIKTTPLDIMIPTRHELVQPPLPLPPGSGNFHHYNSGTSHLHPSIPISNSGGETIVLGAPKPTISTTVTASIRKSSMIPINTVGSGSSTITPSNTRILTGVDGIGSDDASRMTANTVSNRPMTITPTASIIGNTTGFIRPINNGNNIIPGISSLDIASGDGTNMFCRPTNARNLFWNITRVGDVNVQPCPGGATGIAKWRCVLMKRIPDLISVDDDNNNESISTTQKTQLKTYDCTNNGTCEKPTVMANKLNDRFVRNFEPTWHPITPDLTQCRSLWLNNLEVRVNQRESPLISIANDLSEVTSSKSLYGGDMLVTTKIIQTMSEKMFHDKETFPDQRQREAIIMELLHGVVKTGSNLLDESQLASWLDLNQEDQMRVATSLLTGLEYNAFLLADTIIRERNVVQKVKNILLSVRVLEAKNIQGNEIFPEPDQWSVSDDRIELPKAALIENSEGGLVRVVFAAFDRLERILKPCYDHFDRKSSQSYIRNSPILVNASEINSSGTDGMGQQRIKILNSKVISASLGKGRHIQLSQPIKLVLRHIKTENVTNPTCVFWNYIDHTWSSNGCSLESTNRTHSICMCNHLTNFAILMDIMDEHTNSLFTMFDGNMRIFIYISISICILFIVIALLTLKILNGGVLVKSTRTSIYRNIYVCLLFIEIVFLLGIELADTFVCGFTTVFIHFFIFATSAWFCFEAFQSYSILTTDDMLLEVDQTCKVNCYYMLSYGISITTVAISVMINPGTYTENDYCVLMTTNKLFYGTFLTPIIIFILGAFIYTCLSWTLMCRKGRTALKNKEHTRLANVRFDIQCSFIFLILLLGVWISCYYYLRLAKIDSHHFSLCGYLFLGFNTIMGLYIFVCHCIQNEKIRREYRKYVRQNSWLPKCLRCSKTSISSGVIGGSSGTNGGNAGLNNTGTITGSTAGGNSSLVPSNPVKKKKIGESHNDMNDEDNNDGDENIITTVGDDAIVATSDCELNESGLRRTKVNATVNQKGGILSCNLIKHQGSKVNALLDSMQNQRNNSQSGGTGTLRSSGGGLSSAGSNLHTPSVGHTSPTSSVGSTHLIFSQSGTHKGQPPGGNSNINQHEAYYKHQIQQQPQEFFFWTQKHSQNGKKKKGNSAVGSDSPSSSLHSRTTATSQQILYYPSYMKAQSSQNSSPPQQHLQQQPQQYPYYAEAIDPYYQQHQYGRRYQHPSQFNQNPHLQPKYITQHHHHEQQQQQLSSDEEQMDAAQPHAHLLHSVRRGGPQLPPVPPPQQFGGNADFNSTVNGIGPRYYRNKHSNCDLNQDAASIQGSDTYYNQNDGPVYEEILSNRTSDVHYEIDLPEDDIHLDAYNSQRKQLPLQHRHHQSINKAIQGHQNNYHDANDDDDNNDVDDDDGDDHSGEIEEEISIGVEEDDNESMYNGSNYGYDNNLQYQSKDDERMRRLMDEDFQRRFQRQQRKNAMKQKDQHYQQEYSPQHSMQHFQKPGAIFGIVGNPNNVMSVGSNCSSVRNFKTTSPNHRSAVKELFSQGPPLPPANQHQLLKRNQMQQQHQQISPISTSSGSASISQQQQQQPPIGRNISAMLDENNTVRCYLEPLSK